MRTSASDTMGQIIILSIPPEIDAVKEMFPVHIPTSSPRFAILVVAESW